jgi:hypothetical protein
MWSPKAAHTTEEQTQLPSLTPAPSPLSPVPPLSLPGAPASSYPLNMSTHSPLLCPVVPSTHHSLLRCFPLVAKPQSQCMPPDSSPVTCHHIPLTSLLRTEASRTISDATIQGCSTLPYQVVWYKPRVAVHACNPSTWEAEAEGLCVPGQTGLHSETLSQKIKRDSICITVAPYLAQSWNSIGPLSGDNRLFCLWTSPDLYPGLGQF